jgi:outer membrane protein assembly factor BamA
VKSSDEFDEYLQENPTVKKSFDEQFILGSSYVFENNNFYFSNRKHSFSISEGIDLSGNLASLILAIANGERPDVDNQYTLLGVPYSQFIRLRSEFRYTYKPVGKSQIAGRVILAAGLPYGNSSTMPYVRQYFVGGTNSLRSFLARSIGPGTYHPPDSVDNIDVDQAGDIKLEGNLEYRFDIYKFFKGALFIDAGNIWLVNEDSQRTGGRFNMNTFYKEIAAGVGYGFRFDFNVVVLRLDLAFPIRKPYLADGERWVINEIDFGSSAWRRENLLWNIAIGYPF